jgi:hypothetical protein
MPLSNPTLERQSIGRGPNGTIVVAQLWAGLPTGRDGRPRWSVVLIKDGFIAPGGRTGTETEAKQFYVHVAGHCNVDPLTEGRARELLADVGYHTEYCRTCSCVLPIGGRFCTACGRPGGRKLPGGTVAGLPAPGSGARPVLLAEVTIP